MGRDLIYVSLCIVKAPSSISNYISIHMCCHGGACILQDPHSIPWWCIQMHADRNYVSISDASMLFGDGMMNDVNRISDWVLS